MAELDINPLYTFYWIYWTQTWVYPRIIIPPSGGNGPYLPWNSL